MKPWFVTAIAALVLLAAQHASIVAGGRGPRVIIVGAGMSGISAGKRLWDAGVRDLLILEGTGRVGGGMHKHNFGGLNVEIGANWVEGLNGDQINPIWPMVNASLKLRNFYSDFDGVVGNVYKESGGLYDEEFVQKRMDRGDEVEELGGKLAAKMDPSGRDDMSILAMQRLFNHQPNGPATPVDMALDYFRYDYEFAEPPRVTSLQGTEPTATFADFGEDAHFVADQRGFETLIYLIAGQYLRSDKSGNIVDPRVKLNKVVREISYNHRGVVVTTEDNSAYSADYVIVSASIGVLQSDLIQFKPQLPAWKIFAIYRFDMAVYTKIFLKFPRKFWPTGPGKQFFVYASSRRGYYGMWQFWSAVVRAGVPGGQRAAGDGDGPGVAADRAAARQRDDGGGRGRAAEDVPRPRRPRRHRYLRAALVVRPLLQGLLIQLARRRQPLRVRPAPGADWRAGLLHRGAHQRALQRLCPRSLSCRYRLRRHSDEQGPQQRGVQSPSQVRGRAES